MNRRSILITGASTGIGRDSAIHLARAGYHVMAGVRRPSDADALRALGVAGLEPVILDVCKDDQIEAIVRRIEQEPRGLYALINNAGHNYNSAFEFADEARSRDLMEVNFFGLARLSQRLIPSLRRHVEAAGETAKLVNISSVGGSFGLPWEVFYHASKFAVVGLTEGLRRRSRPSSRLASRASRACSATFVKRRRG